MKRFRFALSQVAVPRRSKLPEPLPMLLDLDDLPAGWTVMDKRRWRTGQTPGPWSQRAKELGGVTAWRSFRSATKEEGLWTEAIPLASDSDVNDALAEIWSRTLENLRANVRLVSEREGPALAAVTGVSRTLEQSTEGPHGLGLVRLAAWGHRGVLSALCASATGEPADWDDLSALAAKQNRRIDLVLNAS